VKKVDAIRVILADHGSEQTLTSARRETVQKSMG